MVFIFLTIMGIRAYMTMPRTENPETSVPGSSIIVVMPGANSMDMETMVALRVEEALHELRKVVEDVPIFCFQNGVRNEETANQYFPRVYGVVIRCGAVFLTNGEVMSRTDPPGRFAMGRYPKGTDNLVETVATSLRHTEFYILVMPDVMPYKWGKLLINIRSPIGAITNNMAGNDYTRLVEAVQEEAREILTRAGIRWVSDKELALEWPESTIQPRSNLNLKVKSSSWQSLTRQQGSVETDFFNGEIVRLANQLGKQAPINEMLLRIMKDMAANREPPGKYTLAELRRLIGLD